MVLDGRTAPEIYSARVTYRSSFEPAVSVLSQNQNHFGNEFFTLSTFGNLDDGYVSYKQ